MNRVRYPKFEVDFIIRNNTINISAKNIWSIYAKYVKAIIQVPKNITYDHAKEIETDKIIDDIEHYIYHRDNINRDIVDSNISYGFDTVSSIQKYDPSWFNPILPGLTET